MKYDVTVEHIWEAEELEVLPFVISATRETLHGKIVVHLNVDKTALKQFNDLMRMVNDGSKDSL